MHISYSITPKEFIKFINDLEEVHKRNKITNITTEPLLLWTKSFFETCFSKQDLSLPIALYCNSYAKRINISVYKEAENINKLFGLSISFINDSIFVQSQIKGKSVCVGAIDNYYLQEGQTEFYEACANTFELINNPSVSPSNKAKIKKLILGGNILLATKLITNVEQQIT